MKFGYRSFIRLLTALLVAGCAAPLRPSLGDRGKLIRTVMLLPPRIDVYEVDIGGSKVRKEEWSSQARKNLLSSMERELRRAGLVVRAVTADSMPGELTANLEESYALFDEIFATIDFHRPVMRLVERRPGRLEDFNDLLKKFDYSLGAEINKFSMGDADAILLVTGADHVATAGLKARMVVDHTLSLLIALALPVPIGVWITGPGGYRGAEVVVALADSRSGSILWYTRIPPPGMLDYDLRDAESSTAFVKKALESFPLGDEKR